MSPYVHEDYRDWLRAFFAQKKARSGLKSQLAQSLGIKTSYLSQVLSNSAHFTAEQALIAGRFFGFTEDETEYFVCCVQKERTQDESLRQFLSSRIQKMRSADSRTTREQLTSLELQLFSQSLPMQAIYEFLKIHKNLPEIQIFAEFQFERSQISIALENLERLNLIERSQNNVRLSRLLDTQFSAPQSGKLRACRDFSTDQLSQHNSGARYSSELVAYNGESVQKDVQKIIAENWAALGGVRPQMVLVNIDLIPVVLASQS